jgi:hypothetical protein
MKIHLETAGGGGILIAVVAVLLSSRGGGQLPGAAAAVLIALAAVVTLIVTGGIAWLVYRTRQNRPGEPLSARLVSRVPPGARPRLEDSHNPAIGPPRELHLHFHGTDPEQVAEILRRQQAEK